MLLLRYCFASLALLGSWMPGSALAQSIPVDSVGQWELEAFNATSRRQADDSFKKLLRALRHNRDSSGWRKVQMGRADLYADFGWRLASDVLIEALADSWWTPDKNTAYLLTYLGYYANQEGNRLLSKQSRESVYDMMKAGQAPWNVYLISNVLRPLGNAYTSFGEHQKAKLILEDAFRYLSDAEDGMHAEELALIASDLAILYQVTGEPHLAISRYKTTLATQQLSPETRVLLLVNFGGALMEIDQAEEAAARAREAIILIRRQKKSLQLDRYLVAAHGTLAAALAFTDKPEQALHQVTNAIRMGKRVYAHPFSREMAALYIQRAGMYQRLQLYRKGLADCQSALERLLSGYHGGDLRSVGPLNRYIPENRLWETFAIQAALLEAQYDVDQDPGWLLAALAAHEAAMRVEALQLQVFAYDESSLSLLASNRTQKSAAVALAWKLYQKTPDAHTFFEALSIAERSRSLLLQDRKNQLALMAGKQAEPELVRRIDQVDSMVAEAQINLRELDPNTRPYTNQEWYLDSLLSQSYGLKNQLIRISPLYASARFGELPFGMDELQIRIPRDAAVISYFLGEKELFIFGLSTDRQLFLKLPITRQFFREINDLSKASTLPYIGRPSLLAQLDSVRKKRSLSLYKQILSPVLDSLSFARIQRTWIIPDGIISSIPFALLHTEAKETTYYLEEPYLILKTSLAMASNLTLLYLQLSRNEPPTSTELLCVAPSYGGAGLGSGRSVRPGGSTATPEGVRLVFHLQEAEYLYNRYGGKILYQQEASTPSFLESVEKYSLLHFSGHAQADSANGNWNFLALEPEDDSKDAFSALWQPQILSLRLQTEMVYLSACETSQGKFYLGEGHSSLARAFLYAGAASVIATLWQIEDSVSLRVSERFYASLENGHPKDLALQETMISMIKENKPPYAWGAYVLWGQPDSISLSLRRRPAPLLAAVGLIVCLIILGMIFRHRRISKGKVDEMPA